MNMLDYGGFLYFTALTLPKFLFIDGEISFFYVCTATCIVAWITITAFKFVFSLTSGLHHKFNELEKILFDLKSGTKTIYQERRKSPRIPCEIKANIEKSGSGELAQILNISYEGAFVRTSQYLQAGDIVGMRIYLPLFPQPIEVSARVVRSNTKFEGWYNVFEVGVEIVNINHADRERLLETVNILSKPHHY